MTDTTNTTSGQNTQTTTPPSGDEGKGSGSTSTSSGQSSTGSTENSASQTDGQSTTTNGTNGETTQTQSKDGQQTQSTTSAPEFKVPDEYKDKPWASKVKTEADLWKQLENTQALVGKKTVIPDLAKADEKTREEFYAQLRPKSADEYQFSAEVAIDPNMKTGVAELLMKNGISATQGNEIIKGYQEIEQKELALQFDPEGMKKSLEAAFGKDWEAITGGTRQALKGIMSEEDNKQLEAIPNVYLGLIYRTLGNTQKAVQNMMKKYGVKETSLAHFAEGGATAPGDINQVRSGIRAQIAALGGRVHTEAQVMELRNKLAATYTAETDPRMKVG